MLLGKQQVLSKVVVVLVVVVVVTALQVTQATSMALYTHVVKDLRIEIHRVGQYKNRPPKRTLIFRLSFKQKQN